MNQPTTYIDRHTVPPYYMDVVNRLKGGTGVLLDLGCSDGWLAGFYQSYVGIDARIDAVTVARMHGRQVLCADLQRSIPIAARSFGIVVAKDILEHLQEPLVLLNEALRVLEPGGLLYVSVPEAQKAAWDDYTHVRPFTRRSLRSILADSGFVDVKISYETVFPGVGRLTRLLGRDRRPTFLAQAKHLPMLPRNIVAVGKSPPSKTPVNRVLGTRRFER